MKVKINELGNYKKIIFDSETVSGKNKIKEIREEHPNAIILFSTGCFDLIQPGHTIFIEQIRSIGKKLAYKNKNRQNNKEVIVVIGVGRDSTLRVLKKGRPINPQMNRAYIMASIKNVDYVVLNNKVVDKGKIDFKNILPLLKPDIFVDIEGDSGVKYKKLLCDKVGISFIIVKRETPRYLTPDSTSLMIKRASKIEK